MRGDLCSVHFASLEWKLPKVGRKEGGKVKFIALLPDAPSRVGNLA